MVAGAETDPRSGGLTRGQRRSKSAQLRRQLRGVERRGGAPAGSGSEGAGGAGSSASTRLEPEVPSERVGRAGSSASTQLNPERAGSTAVREPKEELESETEPKKKVRKVFIDWNDL